MKPRAPRTGDVATKKLRFKVVAHLPSHAETTGTLTRHFNTYADAREWIRELHGRQGCGHPDVPLVELHVQSQITTYSPWSQIEFWDEDAAERGGAA